MKLSIVIPAYNEEATIEAIVRRVQAVDLGPIEKEIIVVNDGSRDGTEQVLKKLSGIRHISHERNVGKGAALTTGFQSATGDIVIIQDAAHGFLSFDREPHSFLAVPGARDVGVEVHSLSKGYDMIGWRIGWVCGNERIVRAFADTKDNFDSGQFIAIQKAAAAALDDPEIPKRTRAKYRRRMEKLVATLGRCGFKCGWILGEQSQCPFF